MSAQLKIVLIKPSKSFAEELSEEISTDDRVIHFVRHATEKNEQLQQAQYAVCLPYLHDILSQISKIITRKPEIICSQVQRSVAVAELLKEFDHNQQHEVTNVSYFNPFIPQHQKIVYLGDVKASDEVLRLEMEKMTTNEKLDRSLNSQYVAKMNEQREKFIRNNLQTHPYWLLVSHSVSIIEPYTEYIANLFRVQTNRVFHSVIYSLESVLHVYDKNNSLKSIILCRYGDEVRSAIESRHAALLNAASLNQVEIFDSPVHERSHN